MENAAQNAVSDLSSFADVFAARLLAKD